MCVSLLFLYPLVLFVVCCFVSCFMVGLCCLMFVVDWHLLRVVPCLLFVVCSSLLVVGCAWLWFVVYC